MDFTRDDATDDVPAKPAAPAAPASPARFAPPANQLSYAVATWLQRVDAAAHPKAKLNAPPLDTDPKQQTQYKLIYVMAPTSGGRHVALCLYKARLRSNGDGEAHGNTDGHKGTWVHEQHDWNFRLGGGHEFRR